MGIITPLVTNARRKRVGMRSIRAMHLPMWGMQSAHVLSCRRDWTRLSYSFHPSMYTMKRMLYGLGLKEQHRIQTASIDDAHVDHCGTVDGDILHRNDRSSRPRHDDVHDALVLEQRREVIKNVVASNKGERALDELGRLLLSIDDLSFALDMFVSKRSVKGVRGVESLAMEMGVLRDRAESRALDVWFRLISAYGRLGRLNSVARCFKLARSHGKWVGTEEDVVHTNQFLHAMHSDTKKLFVRARQLMQSGTFMDTVSFNVLLKSCMREGDTKRANMVLSWMREYRVRPDSTSYSTLIKIFSYSNNFDGVLYVMDLMEINGFVYTDDVCSNLLIACGNACQHDTALMIWRDIKSNQTTKHVSMALYEAMMISCNQASQGDRSLELLDEIKECGMVPSVKAYNLALSACRAQPGKRARHLDLIHAINIVSEMRVRGVELDQFTYGQLFEICAEAGQGQIASWLQMSMTTAGVKPNVIINTSLMKALIRGNMVEDAMEIFTKMIWGPASSKPTGATYRTLAKELREKGYVIEALQIYTSMRKAKFAPNNIEFQKLISAAAERAFSQRDAQLQSKVAELCRVTSLSTLDLHGTSRYEARAAVLCVLGMIATEFRTRQKQPGPLTIIVGRGGHSSGNEPVLPGVVRSMLVDELRVRLVEDDTEHFEELQPISKMEGRIVIPGSILLQWLQGNK